MPRALPLIVTFPAAVIEPVGSRVVPPEMVMVPSEDSWPAPE